MDSGIYYLTSEHIYKCLLETDLDTESDTAQFCNLGFSVTHTC